MRCLDATVKRNVLQNDVPVNLRTCSALLSVIIGHSDNEDSYKEIVYLARIYMTEMHVTHMQFELAVHVPYKKYLFNVILVVLYTL